MKHIFFALSVLLSLLFLLPGGAFAATRSLYNGVSGSDVVALQNNLISTGYLDAKYNTGYYGRLTETAIKKFQCDKGVICSGASVSGYGVYGPKTRAAMAMAAHPGSTSTDGAILTGKSLTKPYTGPLEFSGWVPDWRVATATADTMAHLDNLKSIMPFGYSVSSEGKLVDHAKITQEPWTSLIATAQTKKVRVVPTVMWGNGTAMQNILSNTTKRIALENEIADTVKKNGFDGIDIDFEAKKHETVDYFSTFLKGLYARMGNKWVYCTVEARMPLEDRYSPGAKIPDDATDFANDYSQMNKYCDRVEIMAYDQGTVDVRLNAARFAPYAPVADVVWVENMVKLAAQSIAKSKLVIGVPTYGYEYSVTPVEGGGFQYDRLWAFNPQYAIQIATKLGITPIRMSGGEPGFVYNPKTLAAVAPKNDDATPTQQTRATTSIAENQISKINMSTTESVNYVTWSDAKAIADKVALARKLGVRGVAVFSLGGAEDPGMWNVLK